MIGDPRQHSAHYLSLCLSLLPLTNCDHLFISSYARGKKLYGDDATNRIFFYDFKEIQTQKKLWFKKIDENSGPRTDGQKPVFKAVSSVQFSLIKNTNATHAMGLRASKPKHVLNATTTTTTTGTPQQTTPGGLRVRISSSLYSSLYSSSFSSLHDKK